MHVVWGVKFLGHGYGMKFTGNKRPKSTYKCHFFLSVL